MPLEANKVRRDVRDANLEAINSIAELMGEKANDFRLAASFPGVPSHVPTHHSCGSRHGRR